MHISPILANLNVRAHKMGQIRDPGRLSPHGHVISLAPKPEVFEIERIQIVAHCPQLRNTATIPFWVHSVPCYSSSLIIHIEDCSE